MIKNRSKEQPLEIPPGKGLGEITPPVEPEYPFVPNEDNPDVIPQEDPFETPPYEVPPPGEGP